MNKLIVILLGLVFFACTNTDVCTEEDGKFRRVNLVVKNIDTETISKVGQSSINNLQVLILNADDKCISVMPLNQVDFDENNTYATTLTVPNTARSITVLANAIGYTYPAQVLFIGATLDNIFMATTHTYEVPSVYYQQPSEFYEGSSSLGDLVDGKDIKVGVDISRVVSKIVVQLASNLNFNDNNGKGFQVINAANRIYINGIDSLFVVDTPAGVNLSLTEYLSDAIGFDYCQIYKATDFNLNSDNMHSDNIVVFPQIDAAQLPYLIFSVTGWKGLNQIGKSNPLYYAMRIKNIRLVTGTPVEITSLPRNVVIVVTINNIAGVGSPVHPNPDYQDMIDLTVEVKSWDEYYYTSGDIQ